MRFMVLKAAFGEVCGGSSSFDSIDEALREISCSLGWENIEQMHSSIRRWAVEAEPGSVFTTRASAIVAQGDGTGIHDDICDKCDHEGMEYEEMSPVEGGNIEQKGWCPECGNQWNDVFILASRQRLFPKPKKELDHLKADSK